MKHLFTIIFFLGCTYCSTAQYYTHSYTIPGSIEGEVINYDEPIINAVVLALDSNAIIKGSTITDFDGNFIIKPLIENSYTIVIAHQDYDTLLLKNIPLIRATTIKFSLELKKKNEVPSKMVLNYVVPLIKNDLPYIVRIPKPNKAINVTSTFTSSPYTPDAPNPSIGAARENGTLYIIDDVEVYNSNSINFPLCDQDMVVPLSGVPAKYSTKEEMNNEQE